MNEKARIAAGLFLMQEQQLNWYSLGDSNPCYRRERADRERVTTEWSPALTDHMAREAEMARPERFDLPTARFVAEYSIQLSYGRIV